MWTVAWGRDSWVLLSIAVASIERSILVGGRQMQAFVGARVPSLIVEDEAPRPYLVLVHTKADRRQGPDGR